MSGANDVSVGKPIAQFAVAGVAALAAFAVGSLLVVREIGQREAIEDARELAELVGGGVVEPYVTDSLLRGDPAARARLDRVVQERVLGERVVRVKLWTRDGRIVYSDEPRLVGRRFGMEADKLEALRSGETTAEVSDLSAPENRFERGSGSLHEVYTRLRTPSGAPLLFETYQESESVVATGREIWLPFAVVLLASLLLLWLTQVPLAVPLVPEVLDRAAEEPELHAALDE